MNTRKQKSNVWEYFDEPIECEEGDSNEKALKKRILCRLCYMKLSDGEGTNTGKAPTRIPVIGEQ